MLRRGDIVRHKKFGLGTVFKVLNRGYMAVVSFGRFRLTLPTSTLERIGDGLKVEGVEVAPPRMGTTRTTGPRPAIVKGAKGDPRVMQVLESLRTGLVPKEMIEEWTFGREQEVKQIKEWLGDRAEGALLIEGEYGMGKSHLMLYLWQLGRKEGYAVAFTGYDPSEKTGAFPKRLYRNLMANFRIEVDGKELDFRGFLEELARKNGAGYFKDHPYLGPFLKTLKEDPSLVDDESWEWIEGRDVESGEYRALLDHSTAANIYCNLLSAFSSAIKEIFGKEGLLVLFDEAEMARANEHRYQNEAALNLIRGLSMTANDDPDLLEEEVRKAEDGRYRGTITGLVYSGHRREIPYIFKIPSHLKVAFAVTPSETARFWEIRSSMPVITLEPLTRKDIEDMFSKTIDAYVKVYGLTLSDRWKNALIAGVSMLYGTFGNAPVRLMVKALVEALDIARFYPGLKPAEIFNATLVA